MRIWEESHESLEDRPWFREEFKIRSSIQQILRYADQDITRCVAQKKVLAEILDLLKSTSEPLPTIPPRKPKGYDPELPAPETSDTELSEEEWRRWKNRKPSIGLSPEEKAELYSKDSS